MAWEFFNALGALKRADGPPAVVMDPWHVVGAAGEPAFVNSWSSFGGVYSPVGFRKSPDGKVMLRGTAQGGASGTTMFTLPVGYRPPGGSYIPVLGDGGAAGNFVYVNTDGTVQGSRNGTTLHLANVEFDTDTVAAYPPSAGLTTSFLLEQVLSIPPAVKYYGSSGPSANVPGGGWTATHTDGSVVSHVITPPIDCWWLCKMNVLARVLDATWCRLECRIKIDPVDADGINWSNGSIMHHSGACDWMQVAGGARSFKLNKGTTYTLTMQLYAVTGTWNVYRAPEHMWLGHDGIRPR